MIFFEYEQVLKLHSSLIDINLLYSQQELIDFGFSIASGKMPKDDIKKWFIEHKK
jgi:hypothetical protein